MHRFIPGLAKLPEKRNITQTEKRQRECVYDRCKRNREYQEMGERVCMACLLRRKECNVLFFDFVLCLVGVGKIQLGRLESGKIMRS